MKTVGVLLMIAGLVFGLYGFTMDVTVTVPAQSYGYGISTPAMTVNNIGLMDERRNYLEVGGFLVVLGILVVVLSPKEVEVTSNSQRKARVEKEIRLPREKSTPNALPPVVLRPIFCVKCLGRLTSDMDFCPKCGVKQNKI